MALLYSAMKVFHYKDKIDSLPLEVSDVQPPLHIRIKPTNACNHNCHYCAYRVDSLQLGQNMNIGDSIPVEKMREIVEDLVEMQVKAVTFSGGGEPFCYPHLLETARRLAESQIRFAALSNGALVKGEVAEVFARHATWLRISMDGWNGESYAKYRGVDAGEFDSVLENIRDFKAFGGSCYLGVSFIVDEANGMHVYDFLRRMRDTGTDSVKISPCIISNDGEENNRYHRPFFDRVKAEVEKAKEELEDATFEIYDSYHLLEEKFAKDYDWCPYLQILPVIGADLNVYSCQDKAYNLECGCLGSIAEQRFRDFWFADKNKFFEICPARDCNHHCVANAKNRLLLSYLDTDKGHLPFI